MKRIYLSLLVIVAMAMASCGNGNTQNNKEGETKEAENKTEVVAATPEQATFDIFSNGEFFVDYMKPTFTVKEEAINPTLHNDNVKVAFVTGLSSTNYDEYKDEFQNGSYKDAEGYSYKEMEINGYRTVMATYEDDFFGKEYCADYFIDFGESINGVYGIKACVTSEKSADYCVAQDIMDILNSMRFVKK